MPVIGFPSHTGSGQPSVFLLGFLERGSPLSAICSVARSPQSDVASCVVCHDVSAARCCTEGPAWNRHSTVGIVWVLVFCGSSHEDVGAIRGRAAVSLRDDRKRWHRRGGRIVDAPWCSSCRGARRCLPQLPRSGPAAGGGSCVCGGRSASPRATCDPATRRRRCPRPPRRS